MAKHPTNRTWVYNTQQGNQGPYNEQQMRSLLAQGTIDGGTWIWREGFDNWVQLSKSGDFALPGDAAQASAQQQQQQHAQQQAQAQQQQAASASSRDDHLDGIFVGLVEKSWKRHRMRERATELDEVLVGGVITAVLDNGYSLIDLNSDGTNHYLRFEDTSTGHRVIFQLQHMAEQLVTSKVIGHEARVTIGYGQRVKNIKSIWGAIKQEMKGGYIRQADPGIITVDGDLSSQYVYVEVGLIWDIADYLDADNPYRVLYPKLGEDIGATLHALSKYLQGRFSGAL